MNDKIITNNPLVAQRYKTSMEVLYNDVSFQKVLEQARDFIHKGHRLLTHPLSGSVKPNETPCKSVLISGDQGPLDLQSLQIIEDSITACRKFAVVYPTLPPDILEDFRTVDYTLFAGALCQHSLED